MHTLPPKNYLDSSSNLPAFSSQLDFQYSLVSTLFSLVSWIYSEHKSARSWNGVWVFGHDDVHIYPGCNLIDIPTFGCVILKS
jgi:hypothetical protein